MNSSTEGISGAAKDQRIAALEKQLVESARASSRDISELKMQLFEMELKLIMTNSLPEQIGQESLVRDAFHPLAEDAREDLSPLESMIIPKPEIKVEPETSRSGDIIMSSYEMRPPSADSESSSARFGRKLPRKEPPVEQLYLPHIGVTVSNATALASK